MKNRLLFLYILYIGVLASCSHQVVLTKRPTNLSNKIQEIDFEYFQGKGQLNIKDKKSERDIKTIVRIRKDSVIWMSFNFIGLNGGKLLITQDSITVVSNLDKTYYVYQYKELSKQFNFGINYQVIQSAILGNLIIPQEEPESMTKDLHFDLLEQHRNSISLNNYVNPENKKLEKVILKESSSGNLVNLMYSRFAPMANQLFPFQTTIEMIYKIGSDVLDKTFSLTFDKVEINNKSLKFPFNIPHRYERK